MNLLEASSPGYDPIPQTGFYPKRGTSQEPINLLLAEDDDDVRLVMEYALSSMGYLVVACADAQLGSVAFHTRVFDVLVTDFEMPGRTGVELARELTSLQPSLPVMVITGSMLTAEMLQELTDRHWIYMSKPSNLATVEATLKRLVKRGHPLTA